MGQSAQSKVIQLEKKGGVVKAKMPQHRYLSGGWYDIRLASKGGRVRMIDRAKGVPPLSVHRLRLRLGLDERTWEGVGVVVGASLFDLQVEEGGRVGTLTTTSLDSDP